MENLDLTKILKYCQEGTKLWSPIFGEVTFKKICDDEEYPIVVEGGGFSRVYFTKAGKYYDYEDAECVLFPSKENRAWGNAQAEYQEIGKSLNSVAVEEIKKTLDNIDNIDPTAFEGDGTKLRKEVTAILARYKFKPFQKVLVRDDDEDVWQAQIYSHYNDDEFTACNYICLGNAFVQCIPYEGNEELLGTTNKPKEE